MFTPPLPPLYSIAIQAQVPPDRQARYAMQRMVEQRAELEQYLGSIAAANAVRFTGQRSVGAFVSCSDLHP